VTNNISVVSDVSSRIILQELDNSLNEKIAKAEREQNPETLNFKTKNK
jgi:hypothetical protein